jgi:hypothetical protein
VWDGGSRRRFCSGTPTIFSTGTQMLVRFFSSVSGVAAGFTATHVAVPLCTTTVATNAVIDWNPPSTSTCASITTVTTPGPLASYPALTITTFTVACPNALVVREGDSLAGRVLGSYCGTHTVPWVLPFTSASSLHVSYVGATTGRVTATVSTVGAKRPTLACASDSDVCITATDATVSTDVAIGCVSSAVGDLDSDGDNDIVCVASTSGA